MLQNTEDSVCDQSPRHRLYREDVRNVFQLQMSVERSGGPELLRAADNVVSQRPLLVVGRTTTRCNEASS